MMYYFSSNWRQDFKSCKHKLSSRPAQVFQNHFTPVHQSNKRDTVHGSWLLDLKNISSRCEYRYFSVSPSDVSHQSYPLSLKILIYIYQMHKEKVFHARIVAMLVKSKDCMSNTKVFRSNLENVCSTVRWSTLSE